ncbi:MAG TPA: carboxypeptidase-like regulatory domain-containing protein [Bacteroidales bacterium]|nr:carboxypeptidase-like regulatory domain-containing protein [Bacteroidales bacterium]
MFQKLLIPAKLLLIMLVLAGNLLYSQSATIRGFIYEKESGEPVIFTNAYLLGTSYGSTTDINGYFAITQIPPGSYTLIVTYLGYDTLTEDVSLKANDLIQKNLYLEKSTVLLDAVNVSAERQAVRTETRTSVVKVTPLDIKQIPSVGGKADLAQYLQVLPGVIFTGDQGGQLYIRGGSPIQNKVFLDGMVIYNPFHSIGLFSVFDTETIRLADIYTGGFNAEHGGRISSVMDITTRDGNKKRHTGKLGLSTFGANALIEGPIKKQLEDGRGSSSFLISAKNSYLEQSSKLFYDYVNEDGLPFNFLDLYGKVTISAANGSKVNLFGFNFTDKVNYKAISEYSWDALGGGVNFVVIPGRTPVLMEGIFAYSSYDMQLDEEEKNPRNSSINGFNAGLDFTYFQGKNEIKYGIEMNGFTTNFAFFNDIGQSISQEQNTTELGGFFKYKIAINKFLIEPGIRAQWYASLSNFSLEPRLAFKYNYSDRTRFKIAGGFYSQNLISARSDRDVVDLFYGFLSGPDQTLIDFKGEETNHKLQKSKHLILGIEHDLFRGFTINLEGYYKVFPQLTNLNRYKIYDASNVPPGTPHLEYSDYIVEKGEAMGADLSLKYSKNRLYFWTAYSYAFVNRYDGMQWYYPHFDRRHNLNMLTAYTHGHLRQWEFSVRWNFGTGFPFTQSQGYYEKLLFPGGINSDYMTENGILGIEYGELNLGRLPTYHRFDVNIKHTFFFTEKSNLQLDFSVTNVYDRPNVFYVNRISGETVRQLPIMPSIGATFTF